MATENKVDVWMPLYVADYLADTTRLTTEQHGAYLLLLMDYWRNGPLPDNDAVLAQITRMSPDAWSNARSILQAFFEQCDGKWKHGRVESELTRATLNREICSKRAKTAAAARWHGNSDSTSNATSNATSIAQAMPVQCPSPSPTPTPSKPTAPNTTRASALSCPPDVDEQVWADFVRHRKTKRAELTATALSGLRREASRAGITLQAALETCCQRGWTGFKADWMRQDMTAPASVSTRRSRIDSYAAQAAAARGEHGHDRHDDTVIDAEVTHLA
jgi:uncharacterized protein YdaU (DUF1376 family)